MLNEKIQSIAGKALSNKFDCIIKILSSKSVGGGCIHHAVKIETNKGPYFLKWNEGPFAIAQLECEKDGLQLLHSAESIYTPEIISFEKENQIAVLILEWIEGGLKNQVFWKSFGKQLANLHSQQSSQFGLAHDNFIGSLPQQNTFKNNWNLFFTENRIMPMSNMAFDNGLLDKQTLNTIESFCKKAGDIFPEEPPVLIHGDLWSGNFLVKDGQAVIFDPAVYYGNREIEIAFTRLFGGFDADFYTAYNYYLPLEPGFENRMDLYNLYPLLVHLNIFGTSYLSGVKRILKMI